MGDSRIKDFPLVVVAGIAFLSVGFLCATERTANSARMAREDFMLPWVPTPASMAKESLQHPNIEPARVGEKLKESLAVIFEGRYELAISKCEEVLRIDPSNVTAIGRMGSAFYLSGEKEKAIALWKRALEMEPNNRTAINLLKKLTLKKENSF